MRKLLMAISVVAIGFAVGASRAPEATCQGVTADIVGTGGNDIIYGTDAGEVINGLGGDDFISGLGGADRICGGPGADVLEGNGSGDDLYGQNGVDRLYGGNGADYLSDDSSTASYDGYANDTVVTPGGTVYVCDDDNNDEYSFAAGYLTPPAWQYCNQF